MDSKRCYFPVLLFLLLLLLILPLFASADGTTISYEGTDYPQDAEYIDLGNFVVKDFDAFTAFLDQMPALKQVDMWQNRMTAAQCDMLAARYPGMRWGWTMVIRNRDHEHLVRTDYTSWSTLHNNTSAKHNSEDFSVLKYCWNLMALDVGHNNVTNLDFLYDLPNLRILIVACNAVEDITPIASLKHLEYLEVFKNRILDISPLEGLDHLMDLNLCFNRIEDLSPVLKLPNLKRLWMYSSRKANAVPVGDDVDAIKAAFPNAIINTTHYSTLGGWRMITQRERDPHYEVILKNFGENHLHPRTEYVPFEDSWPSEDVVIQDSGEPLELLVPQDFSDKGYLLPVDYSTGSAPKASGYTGHNTYSDSTITVTIDGGVYQECEYWTADIILKDASQLRTLAASLDGSFETTGQMDAVRLAERANAVLAINGDYFSSSEKRGLGYIVRQGTLYENNLEPVGKWNALLMDVLLVDEDGDFTGIHQPQEGSVPARINGKRVLNSFSFGPILVENGRPVDDFRGTDRWFNMAWMDSRQRICICQVDHLHYKVVCCAGPSQKNGGMTIRQFADFVATLDVKIAYNLDGGDSTLLFFGGNKVNELGYQSQRKLTDIIYFASAE